MKSVPHADSCRSSAPGSVLCTAINATTSGFRGGMKLPRNARCADHPTGISRKRTGWYAADADTYGKISQARRRSVLIASLLCGMCPGRRCSAGAAGTNGLWKAGAGWKTSKSVRSASQPNGMKLLKCSYAKTAAKHTFSNRTRKLQSARTASRISRLTSCSATSAAISGMRMKTTETCVQSVRQ